MATAYGSRLTRLAAKQHGVISRDQAKVCGVAGTTINRRLQTGTWERLYPGVYRLGGTPGTWRQSLKAACLAMGEGVAVSHLSAAGLFEIVGFPARGIELSVPRARRRMRGIKVHRPISLKRVDVTTLDAISVTTPARTLIDLATCVDADLLEEALDDALRRGLVQLPRLKRRMTELGARTVLKDLVEERAHGVTESNLEIRVLRALRAAGLPKPSIQHHIGRYRADLAYPDAHIVIECDSYRFHSGRRRFDADRARRNVLTARGWTVLHATWRDVEQLVATVAALIA
jgi:very-short-patch-repair endonuclease/predicted transcriptional regulator of viral defense system